MEMTGTGLVRLTRVSACPGPLDVGDPTSHAERFVVESFQIERF
jgi:hypothetical protein